LSEPRPKRGGKKRARGYCARLLQRNLAIESPRCNQRKKRGGGRFCSNMPPIAGERGLLLRQKRGGEKMSVHFPLWGVPRGGGTPVDLLRG